MNLRETISALAAKRIWLREENGRLGFSRHDETIDSDIQKLIGEHHDSLLDVVRRHSPYRCLIAPASKNQSSLVFIQKLSPYSAAYNVVLCFRLCTPLTRQAFESACRSLIHHHTQLKASFQTITDDRNGDYISTQIIKDCDSADIRYDEREIVERAELRQAVIAEENRPFNIETGPLIRWTVFNAASASPVVLITMHHSIMDGWSLRIIVQELFSGYRKRISLPEPEGNDVCTPSFGYIDFTLHQNELFLNGYFDRHSRFFREKLLDRYQPIGLQTDFPRPEIAQLRGGSIPFIIPPDLYNKIVTIAQQEKITIRSVLFTAYMLLLYEETKQDRFVVGMPVKNRTIPSFHNVVGYFVNILVIPFQIHGISTYRHLLKQIYTMIEESVEYQELPFPSLVDVLNPPRDASRAPIFQVLFNFLSPSLLGPAGDFMYEGLLDDSPHLLEGVEVRPFPIPQQEGQYDLTLEIIKRNGYASGQLKFSTALFTESRMQRLSRRYLEILETIADKISEPFEKNNRPAEKNKERIVFAATFTADLLADGLNFWIDRLGLECVPQFAPYGQVMQQLLDPTSLFRTNGNGCNVILLRLDDLCYSAGNSGTFSEILSARCEEILSAVAAAASSHSTTYFIFFCPSAPGLMAIPATQSACDELQSRYTKLLNALPGVYATSTETMLSWYPVGDYHDPVRLDNGHIPYTGEFFIALSTAIIRRIFVTRQKPIKVIAADCDNTLWSGVTAEDGSTGVTVSDGHRELQKLLSQQPDAGRLLTLVSKNREEDVDAVFSRNSAMVLSAAAIHSRRINWEAKSDNIRSLADEINVGIDGFLFIDDNPVECAEVSAALPQALVLRFPAASSEIPVFLSGLWMLDNPKTTEEDHRRSEFYRVEKQRNVIRSQTASLVDFLEKLELTITFDEINDLNGERLSQLTYRTNQFNFSGGTYSYQELCRLRDEGHDIRAVAVKDRFGDYGIVGMTNCHIEGCAAVVDTFLLSCRVLGRGVEHRMVRMLAETASGKNASELRVRYSETDRNRPAMAFIENIIYQCPSAKRTDGSVAIALSDIPRLSVVSAAGGPGDTERQPSSSERRTGMEQAPQDIAERNRHYRDIVENLSSLDRIGAAVEHFLQRKLIRTELSVPAPAKTSPLEKEIAQIWKRTLHAGEVDTTINFFDIGGTSLQLPQVMADLEKAFNIKLMLVDLFKYTSVRALAEYIQGMISPAGNDTMTNSDSVNKRLSGMQAMRQRQKQSRSRLNT